MKNKMITLALVTGMFVSTASAMDELAGNLREPKAKKVVVKAASSKATQAATTEEVATPASNSTDTETKTSILSSVKNGVTGATSFVKDGVTGTVSSVKNGICSAGSKVKNGVTGTTSWGWNKTKDSTSAAYSFVWGNRAKWEKVTEAVVAVGAGAYILNNMFGDDVKEMLGFEPTEDNCDICA